MLKGLLPALIILRSLGFYEFSWLWIIGFMLVTCGMYFLGTKACIYCKERICEGATKCKNCHSEIHLLDK